MAPLTDHQTLIIEARSELELLARYAVEGIEIRKHNIDRVLAIVEALAAREIGQQTASEAA